MARGPTGQTHEKLRELVNPDLTDFSPVENELTGYPARERRKLNPRAMTMKDVEWLAFVGHLRGGQASSGLLNLFCSPECAKAAGHERFQPITRSAALQSVLINMSDVCSQCGKEFTTPAPTR